MNLDDEGVQFGNYTHEEIQNLSVVEVTESTLQTKGQPKIGVQLIHVLEPVHI